MSIHGQQKGKLLTCQAHTEGDADVWYEVLVIAKNLQLLKGENHSHVSFLQPHLVYLPLIAAMLMRHMLPRVGDSPKSLCQMLKKYAPFAVVENEM